MHPAFIAVFNWNSSKCGNGGLLKRKLKSYLFQCKQLQLKKSFAVCTMQYCMFNQVPFLFKHCIELPHKFESQNLKAFKDFFRTIFICYLTLPYVLFQNRTLNVKNAVTRPLKNESSALTTNCQECDNKYHTSKQ